MSTAKVSQTEEGWAFWCPGCDEAHHVNDRWTFNGNEEAPTFSPSVLVRSVRPKFALDATPHTCHSFVTDGRIQMLGDCTHALANQTVDLPVWRRRLDDIEGEA